MYSAMDTDTIKALIFNNKIDKEIQELREQNVLLQTISYDLEKND